jgi:hypothetical protein
MRKLVLILALFTAAATPALTPAWARSFTSEISESAEIPRLRPEFKIPDEPNQLFYIQRSPNSNTVIYAAGLDVAGNLKRDAPVEVFWRKFNIDGSKQPLNFMERMMAYGVKLDRPAAGQPISFSIAPLPERKLTLSLDGQHRPQALMQIGNHKVKVAYVYLHVVEGGLMPKVPELDIFGTDIASGKAIHEHLIQK